MTARRVHCTLHGPMVFDEAAGTYYCGQGGSCLAISQADLEPYWALTDDEIRLTPPERAGVTRRSA